MIRTLDADRKSLRAEKVAAKFANQIIAQPDAVNAYLEVVDTIQSSLYNPAKPIFSMLTLGPTGTGKTSSFDAFVEGMFGDKTRSLTVDCAEFQHSHEIAKLVGSPPGYLGHRETHPFFTNASLLAARSDANGQEILPWTAVRFDEIEKASDALWNLILGILDKGLLTTGTNEKVNFKPTVIVMTSNVGASEMANENPLGFAGTKIVDDEKLEQIAMNAARKKFMPEFLNRLNKILMFKTLDRKALEDVLKLELQKVQDVIMLQSNTLFEIQVSNSAFEQLVTEGYDVRYNARHLIRSVEARVMRPLSRLVSTQQINHNDLVVIDYLKDWDQWKYMAKNDFTQTH